METNQNFTPNSTRTQGEETFTNASPVLPVLLFVRNWNSNEWLGARREEDLEVN